MCSGFGNESWPHENNLVQGVEHTDTHIDALVQGCSFSGTFAMGILGAVSIRKTVFPGMAIPMLKIRRPSGRLIFNMEIAIRR